MNKKLLKIKKAGKISDVIGRAISLTEMLHNMLKYSEVVTYLKFWLYCKKIIRS